MMRIKSLSIRDILLLTISALTLIITLQAAREVYVNWQQLVKIESLKQAVAISDKLFDATEKLSEERDIAYTILHASDKDTVNDLRARLEESGQAADTAFALSMDALKTYDFPELIAFRDKIEKHLSDIQRLRQQIDQAVTMPPSKRNHELSDQWFAESTDLIVQIQDLWVEFSKHFTDIDPIVTQHLRYKHFLRVISDYTGRQRAIIGRLIVENADPTPEEFAQLLQGQGIIELGWKFARILADQSGLYASIGPYYIDAKSHYQTLYGMVHDIFYVPAIRHGASYPISVDLWLELSAQAKESFDALKNASLQGIRDYVGHLEMEARHAIALHMAILLFTMLLCAYSFRMIIRRVIYPINAMVEALVGATQGKTSSLPPMGNAQDEISKLVQVLHAFQESSERYRALIEASSQVVFTWKPGDDSGMDVLTEWWEKTTGQPASEVLPSGWVNMVHPDDREWTQELWAKASASGDNYAMEYRIRSRRGGYRWVYVRGVGIKRADGSIRELVGTLTDVTERKNAEEALASYTRALERSNQELDDFAYIASHDLKEPLRGLFNHASFLIEDYSDKLGEDGVRRLQRLSQLSQRMEHLVNDLLYFSRLGRTELAVQETDPNAVVHDIEQMMEPVLHEHNARIVVPTPMPNIVCDKPRITEVFRNLITNAVKYNDKPERIVEVGFLENITAPHGTEKNVFYVKDNGVGIEREFYEEIFRMFKRLQNPVAEKERGTGAGLTFVKKIIERHKGRIWLESEMGKGTTFYFTLG